MVLEQVESSMGSTGGVRRRQIISPRIPEHSQDGLFSEYKQVAFDFSPCVALSYDFILTSD